ncbi:UPF0691 protein C9orf116 homolog [Ornithorhynchus anatinus]|uniref:Piercer of microtubule wall 1 n=1 Tax=Ornithorhynchus anatinus TaxID=9258 RepID=A0A6I8PJ97_ORNAN|nr:UPF0691 protein C9orf116 homolog [Ornithorhynchus anatinus]
MPVFFPAIFSQFHKLLTKEEGKMPEDRPQQVAGPSDHQAGVTSPQTSDYYLVSENLPARFNHPGCFRGYRTKESHPLYRTANQSYGSRAPTVHEMPTTFNTIPHHFSSQLATCGMYRNNSFNTVLEKSSVTGPDNLISFYNRFNFHPSYNVSQPSICK